MNENEVLHALVQGAGLKDIDMDASCVIQLDSLQMSELAAAISELLSEEIDIGNYSLRQIAQIVSGSHAPTVDIRPREDLPVRLVNAAPRHNNTVELRPVGSAQISFLYRLAIDEEVGFRWRFRSVPPDEETFNRTLWNGVLVQFCVHLRESGQPVGLVVCYNSDLANGSAYVGAVFAPPIQGLGMAASAVKLFINYVFKAWPLRKLYFELPEFNYEQFASGEGRSFHLEGRLRNHEYFDGRYWDKIILAVYPDTPLEATRSHNSPS